MTNRPREAQPINRNGYWYLVRRVPRRFANFDKRGTVLLSTRIPVRDDPRAIRARTIVRQLDEELQKHWRDLVAGASTPDPRHANRAVELHMPYVPSQQPASYALEEIKERFLAPTTVNALAPDLKTMLRIIAAVVAIEGHIYLPLLIRIKKDYDAELQKNPADYARRILDQLDA